MNKHKPVLLTGFVQAGFPSPGEDLEGSPLDTNALLVRNPAATFFMRVSGESMQDAGIFENDIVVIDRSIEPADGDTIVAVLNGAYTLKKLEHKSGKTPKLVAANKSFDDISPAGDDELSVWGVVTFVLRSMR